MSLRDPYRRRSGSAGRWLLAAALLAAGVALGAAGHYLWQRSIEAARESATQGEVAALRAELEQTNGRLATVENRLPEVDSMAGLLAAMQTTLSALQADVAALRRGANAAAAADGGQSPAVLPPEVRLTVARQTQAHSLSCESSAASMAVQYHGVSLGEEEVLVALPRNPNPHLGFRGQVDGSPGSLDDYGVYAGPVLAVLNSRGIEATPVVGGLNGIKAALARGNPVIAWVTYNCLVSTPVSVDVDGRSVSLVPYQHAVVVTGYNGEGVWANDPYDGQEDFYGIADFERALGYFDEMAIEVAGPQ